MVNCSGAYIKPMVKCEYGKNDGRGNDKSDCWLAGELGTVIKIEDLINVE